MDAYAWFEERRNTYSHIDEQVVALRSPYEAADIVRRARDAGQARHMGAFVGSWDKPNRYWWFHTWAWRAVAASLRAQGIDLDDDTGMTDEDEPPKEEPRRESPPKQAEKPSPYDVLGVRPGASPDEIETAWKMQARQWHPDLIPPHLAPELIRFANERMAQINAAHDLLKRSYAGR